MNHETQPAGGLLLIAAIFLVVKSPAKLRTLGRMVVALLVTALVITVPVAILRIGDPEAWGQIAALVGLLAAVIAGWWHTRSLKRLAAQTAQLPPSRTNLKFHTTPE